MFRTLPVHHQERFVQAVFADLVCGNTRTTRHVQPLKVTSQEVRIAGQYMMMGYDYVSLLDVKVA